MMSDNVESLIAALTERDRLKTYISNLDRLAAEGEVPPEQEARLRSDYEQRIANSDLTVEASRAVVRQDVTAAQREMEATRSELRRLQARHKVGEVTLAQYRAKEKKLNQKAETLERNVQYLSALLQAETAGGLDTVGVTGPLAGPGTSDAAQDPFDQEPAGRGTAHRDSGPVLSLPRSPLGIIALILALVLFISIRLPWLGASEALGAGLSSEAGVRVSFLVGLGGVVSGLGGTAAGFLRRPGRRGLIHAILGSLAVAALAGAVFLREIPLHDSYFMQLVSLKSGFFVYVIAAIALACLGVAERRQAD